MKYRLMALPLLVVLCLNLLTGCGGSPQETPTEQSTERPVETAQAAYDPSRINEPERVVEPSTKLKDPPDEAQMLYDVNHFGLGALSMG